MTGTAIEPVLRKQWRLSRGWIESQRVLDKDRHLNVEPQFAVLESAVQTAATSVHTGGGVAYIRHLLGRHGGVHRPLVGDS